MAIVGRAGWTGWILLWIIIGGCGGGTDSRSGGSFPLVDAPLDTVGVVESAAPPDTGVVATSAQIDLDRPGWLTARIPGYPPPKSLRYTRYVNGQYGYSLALPDALFGPVQVIGAGRGMEFATRDSTSRILVYADEGSSQDDFEELYQNALLQPEGRVTFRARESGWYIVSGTGNSRVFYEKSVLSGDMLRTLRIEYPADQRAYFDAVAAVISASFD